MLSNVLTRMTPLLVMKQMLLVVSFAFLPLLWFVLAGEVDGLYSVIRLDMNEALGIVITTPVIDALRATGLVLLTAAMLQYHLPFGLFPRYLPLLCMLDRILFLNLTIIGSILVGIYCLVR